MEASPDILVADMVMPRMGGLELAERLTALHPRLPVLFMSGYSEQHVAREQRASSVTGFLQKPFTSTSLVGKVRDVLDRARQNDLPTGPGKSPILRIVH
jgi:two-component system cell cycle sensor histidine kinase/response regulator CckA